VSVKKLSTRTTSEINTVLAQFSNRISALYDVDNYEVLYKTTDPQGNVITVSGLMSIPKKAASAKSPRISYQHGTIFLDKDAPSKNHGVLDYEVMAASFGYIVTSPDYIGYGASAQQPHPHTHEKTLVDTSLDLIRASKTWLKQQSIKENGQLFLMGYSEGGYATYAIQKKIEQQLANEFTVTASVPAASAYNLTTTIDTLLNNPVDTFLFYGFIIKGYDDAYQLGQIPDMIKQPYADVLENLYDRKHSGKQINAKLPPAGSRADVFFKADYLQKLKNHQSTPLTDKLAENNIDNWLPQAPTRFFQNPQDELVPFQPVENMALNLRNQGADVDLVVCDANGAVTSHGNCFVPSLFFTTEFFLQFATDL
jgi:pimeloyl-ACP methyl ester carboxylesterase